MKEYGVQPNSIGQINEILKKATGGMIQEVLKAEMDNHLGYQKHKVNDTNNSRNGTSTKKVIGSFGKTEIEIPRDRNSEFEPQIIQKHQKDISHIEQKIIYMYSIGTSTRDIVGTVKEIYGFDLDPSYISKITDKILPQIDEFRTRALDKIYPMIFIDGIRFKARESEVSKEVSKLHPKKCELLRKYLLMYNYLVKMKNIIIGNGVNIKFDKNNDRWKKFNINCQTNFLEILNNFKNSKNQLVNSVWLIWIEIKRYINLDLETKSLENIVRYFNIFHYNKKFFTNKFEYEMFTQSIWGITMIPFMNNQTFNVPNLKNNNVRLFELNMNLEIIKGIYKKAVEITLFKDYKINDIEIPDEFITFLNQQYKKVITLNYDNNLDNVNNLIKIHGDKSKKNIEINNIEPKLKIKNNNMKRQIKEFAEYYKKYILDWDMVLEYNSNAKKKQLDTLKIWKKSGFKFISSYFQSNSKNFLKIFKNKNVKFNSFNTYETFSQISGEVELIGISPENDKKIIDELINNQKIKKITIYNDEKEMMRQNNIIYKHYNDFWKTQF